jgi:hypothetical protein
MKNRISGHFALALLAASLLAGFPALAQTNPAGTVSSGAASNLSFPEIVDQDVSKEYYSAEQGAKLKEQFEGVQERVDASLEKVQASMAKTASIAQSGNQMTFNQIGGMINSEGKGQLGGTPEQIAEQAEAIYGAAHMQLEVTQAVIDNAKPAVQDIMNEAGQILATRADLIKNNPNIDSTVKSNVAKEASAVHDIADHGLEKGLSTLTYELQTAQANLKNNKSAIVTQIENTIATNAPEHGSDPKKWPQSNTAKTPSTNSTQPNASATQKPAETSSTSSQKPATASSSTGNATKSSSGTVPTNQSDSAFSATRNTNSDQGTKNASNSGTSKTTANNAATPSASSTSKATTTVKNTAVSQPTPQKPPPQNSNNPLNNLPQTKIPTMTVAKPSSTNPNAVQDNTAVALLNKPSPTPSSSNGNPAVIQGSTTQSGTTAMAPSNSTQLGLPVSDQGGQATEQAQKSETQPSEGNTANTGNATTSGAQSSGETSAETASSSAETAAAEASNDASSSGQAVSESKQVKKGTIPDSSPDPAFDAHRNDPNYDANQASNSDSGIAVGPTSATGDSTLPPTSDGYPGGDAAEQANAQQKENNDMAKENLSKWEQAKADQQRAQDAEVEKAEAEIFKNIRPGVSHLVEGDEGIEGIADATPAVQMPVITTADLSVEVGDTVTTASLSPIYRGYIVAPGQHGSSVIVAGTTQVAAPSAVLSAPSLQVQVPTSVMTAPSMQVQAPSNQVQVPSAVMTVPSMQVQVPSDVMTVPSSQINFPSSVMNTLDLQPALCGR